MEHSKPKQSKRNENEVEIQCQAIKYNKIKQLEANLFLTVNNEHNSTKRNNTDPSNQIYCHVTVRMRWCVTTLLTVTNNLKFEYLEKRDFHKVKFPWQKSTNKRIIVKRLNGKVIE